ncbi:hypothetical protein [Mesorhizobium caraganae]|uniref:hypothetical protein n=1 Tax=Mesorhizobium caraganae TaxID=483206 RepID=UPI003335DCBC
MAEIKNVNRAVVKEPEAADAPKGAGTQDSDRAPASPTTAGAIDKNIRGVKDPFAARRSGARPVAGKTPRPSERPGE